MAVDRGGAVGLGVVGQGGGGREMLLGGMVAPGGVELKAVQD